MPHYLLKGRKLLLLDIDYTLMDEETLRPHLKEFLERVGKKYVLGIYTAASRSRALDFLRAVNFLGVDNKLIKQMLTFCLTKDNCPTIEFRKENGGVIHIKCMEKAAQVLKMSMAEIILLDDNPTYDHPHRDYIIQAEGFMADMVEDDYLLRLEIDR